MTSEDQRSIQFSDTQRDQIELRRVDQDRTLVAMHELEQALGTAAPAREARWRETVFDALLVLGDATREEAENAERPDSLLSDIAFNQPRLRSRVRGLRTQYRQLQQSLDDLRREFQASADAEVDFADIRQRLAWLLTALRHQRARQSDLIYEAYYEAFQTDLGRETHANV
jgi:small-conductance mechanosensitive channel